MYIFSITPDKWWLGDGRLSWISCAPTAEDNNNLEEVRPEFQETIEHCTLMSPAVTKHRLAGAPLPSFYKETGTLMSAQHLFMQH